MTRREKVLAFGIAGTLGGLALVMFVQWFVLDPFNTVHKDITEELKRAQRLRVNLQKLDREEDRWRGLTGRTFSEDPKEAQQLFREDVQQLLVERHGMKQAKISPGTFVRYKDGSTGVPITINATGTLNQIVGFLCDFYRRDYLARLDKVRVQADMNVISNANSPARNRPAAARGGRGKNEAAPAGTPAGGGDLGPDGPELKLNVSAVALVLPRMKDMEHPVMGTEIVDLDHGRLLRTDLPEYNAIFVNNPFMPYREPQMRVADVPAATPPATQPNIVGNPPPPPPPPPPVGRDQQFVVCTTALNGKPLTYVLDKRSNDTPVKKYYLDDKIDDGTLLLILPRGLVVAARLQGGGEHNYFYPLGRSFSDREEVSGETHPEVAEALQKAFVQ